MKWTYLKFLILFVLLFSSELLSGASKKYLIISEEGTGKVLGRMSVDEFAELTKGAKITKEERQIEEENGVKIIAPKNYEFRFNERRTVLLRVVWMRKDKIIIKEVPIKWTYEIEKSWIVEFYEDVAFYGFPVLVVIVSIAVAL